MHKNIVAIIQARMGSTRLPGKVMMDISGKQMLWHVIKRLEKSELITKVVVATSVNKKDDKIAGFCKHLGIDYFRGSEEDVLDRYYQTAKQYEADIIARVTSDCPLIDYEVVDRAIRSFLDSKNIFDVSFNAVRPTYPRGLDVEVIPFKVLEEIWEKSDQKHQREHVSDYIYENKNKFKILSIENEKDLSSYRWTVDNEADMRFVREIYKKLYKEKKYFGLQDIVQLLQEEPELIEINSVIEQKPIKI